MSSYEEYTRLGRDYLQIESYGASAFCFFRALKEEPVNNNAWNGIILSLSLMRKESDATTMLARYALQKDVHFDKELVTVAMMLWQNNPGAMAEWVREMIQKPGMSDSDKDIFVQIAEDLEKAKENLVKEYGDEALKAQGIVSLAEFASRPTELDLLFESKLDDLYAQINVWLENEETTLYAVRFLSLVPDPRSEKLLRRVCRNENVSAKTRTHALLALRWLGVRGNVKLNKFNEGFTVDLDDPQPELTVSVPASYQPALQRMKVWIAKEKGLVTTEEYEAFASNDQAELTEELNAKIEEAEVPTILQEVAHALIRAAYDQYYPLVPTVNGYRQWAAAFLMLMKEYAVGVGAGWPFGEPEQEETAIRHRNWLLSASPDFQEQIAAAVK